MLAFDSLMAVFSLVQHELLLFCAIFFAIAAIDDIAIDAIWLTRRRRRPVVLADLPPLPGADWFAVFVPAWREAGVIGPMLAYAARAWAGQPVTLFVGVYRNDPAGLAEVRGIAARTPMVRLILHNRDGPTSKADCLNRLWQALADEEARRGRRARAIVLHDAEDRVHADELRVYAAGLADADMVQLPVRPLLHHGGASAFADWMAGHYADEFAEAHGKQLAVRQWLCGAIPSAGTACAFDRALLGRLAMRRGGQPFAADSLTEDYELGLAVPRLGGRARLAEIIGADGQMVAAHAYFPYRLNAAVRQKARWVTGIALCGWDRLGWRGGWADLWMLLRDRRAPMAAVVLTAGYALALLSLCLWAVGAPLLLLLAGSDSPAAQAFAGLMLFNAAALLWRLVMRGLFAGRAYGWRTGLLAVPRAVISNMVAILAARRAVLTYLGLMHGGSLRWDATAHQPPVEAERATARPIQAVPVFDAGGAGV